MKKEIAVLENSYRMSVIKDIFKENPNFDNGLANKIIDKIDRGETHVISKGDHIRLNELPLSIEQRAAIVLERDYDHFKAFFYTSTKPIEKNINHK